MRTHTTILLAATLLLTGTALAGQYVGGGTFVVKTQYGTILDNGGVVCDGTDGSGTGGGCLLFPHEGREGGFVRVHDNQAGESVAFQVCIDNSGDGICGGPVLDGTCRDQIFFSHNDEGRFFNALGPLPTSFLPGCESNGGFPGYVVLLCQGAHQIDGGSHTHALTTGQIGLASFGTGYGNFCGGGFGGGVGGPTGFVNAAAKAYKVV